MKHFPTSQLFTALTVEHAALLDFVALLEREQGMLIENDANRLFELSEQKSNSALSLNECAETRRALLHESIPEFDPDAIRVWLKAHSPENLVIWQEVLALAARAQQLNRTNGELIQMKLRHNQQSLAVLSNAVNRTHLYGPDGQRSFSPGSGRSLGNS